MYFQGISCDIIWRLCPCCQSDMLLPWSVAQVRAVLGRMQSTNGLWVCKRRRHFLLLFSSHLPGHNQSVVCVSRCVFCTSGIELWHNLPDLSEDTVLIFLSKDNSWVLLRQWIWLFNEFMSLRIVFREWVSHMLNQI